MSAVLAPCRRYRYRLDRNVHLFGTITLGFCLHNPSTADEVADDPTVRRCISFAEALDAKRLVIVNAWAGRATDPAELWKLDDPIGPDNDAHIADVADEVAASGGFIIAGWGRPPGAGPPKGCGCGAPSRRRGDHRRADVPAEGAGREQRPQPEAPPLHPVARAPPRVDGPLAGARPARPPSRLP